MGREGGWSRSGTLGSSFLAVALGAFFGGLRSAAVFRSILRFTPLTPLTPLPPLTPLRWVEMG